MRDKMSESDKEKIFNCFYETMKMKEKESKK